MSLRTASVFPIILLLMLCGYSAVSTEDTPYSDPMISTGFEAVLVHLEGALGAVIMVFFGWIAPNVLALITLLRARYRNVAIITVLTALVSPFILYVVSAHANLNAAIQNTIGIIGIAVPPLCSLILCTWLFLQPQKRAAWICLVCIVLSVSIFSLRSVLLSHFCDAGHPH